MYLVRQKIACWQILFETAVFDLTFQRIDIGMIKLVDDAAVSERRRS